MNHLKLPIFSIGTMRWGQWGANWLAKDAANFMTFCFDLGLNSYDLADIYGGYTTEKLVGNAIMSAQIPRESLFITTKCGIVLPEGEMAKHYNTSAKYIIAQVEKSLLNLKTDYIDLLLIHRPNPLMQGDEIARAVDKLKSHGKIKHFGVSNFLPFHLDYLKKFVRIEVNQIQLSWEHFLPLFNGELLYLKTHEILPMIWSPIGDMQKLKENDKIQKVTDKFCKNYGLALEQILIQFVRKSFSEGNIILGSTTKERIFSMVSDKQVLLSDTDWFEFLEANRGRKIE